MRPVLFTFICALTLSSAAPAKEFSRVVSVSGDSFTIQVQGSAQPRTRAIIIENVGDSDIVDPILTANGHGNWFDPKSIARAAFGETDGLTDRDKAFLLQQYWWRNRFPMTPPGDALVLDPTVFFNIYGYGNCGCTAAAIVTLAEAAGLKARVWEIFDSIDKSGHTVCEFFFDGAWHLFDADQGFFYLERDNRTVASIETVRADSSLIIRTIDRHSRAMGHYGFYRNPDDCYVQEGYDRYRLHGHTMALTLRPGESIERSPDKGGLFYDCWNERQYKPNKAWGFPPDIYGSGKIRYKLPIPDVTGGHNLTSGTTPDGDPALVVLQLLEKRGDPDAQLAVNTRSPYVIVGGRLHGEFYRLRNTPLDYVGVTLSNPWTHNEKRTEGAVPVWGAVWRRDLGHIVAEADYTHLFQMGEAKVGRNREGVYEYDLKINMGAGKSSRGATDGGVRVNRDGLTGIKSLELETDIQVAPNSLPVLHLGENKIVFKDNSEAGRKVKITYIWDERNDNNPPDAPSKALSPGDGKRVRSKRDAELAWEHSIDADEGDTITNYHLQVSHRPDCLYPITRPLDRELDGKTNSWTVPSGWLNPKTSYYWRVRARDIKGDWGPWSDIWSFSTR
ncbi:transglutaminase domain-containing protein [candidate division KSB1 bacterium]